MPTERSSRERATEGRAEKHKGIGKIKRQARIEITEQREREDLPPAVLLEPNPDPVPKPLLWLLDWPNPPPPKPKDIVSVEAQELVVHTALRIWMKQGESEKKDERVEDEGSDATEKSGVPVQPGTLA